MKKILLILALLSLGVSKAQVVGGYLPLNSTKSATMGGLRVNGNETVTGTFSVGSTATVSGNALFSSSVGIGALPSSSLSAFQMVKGTGSVNIGEVTSGFPAIWFDTPLSTSNYALRGNASNTSLNAVTRQQHNINNTTKGVWTSTGLRVGSSSDPSAVLDVTGDAKVSTTFSLGSANLTGGNTGTVAVLSDALFSVNFMGGSLNPADATTYWFGNTILAPSTTSTVGRITIPYNCTLVGYNFNTFIGGTNGSTESVTVTVSGTTNYTLTSSAIFSTAVNNYSANGLSQSFSANDSENISIICPTWATNPTVMLFGCTLWFVRRT